MDNPIKITMNIARANRTNNNNPLNDDCVDLILSTEFTNDKAKYGNKTIKTLLKDVGKCHVYELSANYWAKYKLLFVICKNGGRIELKTVGEMSDFELTQWTRYGIVVYECDKTTNNFEESYVGSMERVMPTHDELEAMRNYCHEYLRKYMVWVWMHIYHVSYEICAECGCVCPPEALTHKELVYGKDRARAKMNEYILENVRAFGECTIKIGRDDIKNPRKRKTKN